MSARISANLCVWVNRKKEVYIKGKFVPVQNMKAYVDWGFSSNHSQR